MIFRPELAAKVIAGEKTVTRRLCSENPRSPWWRDGCRYREGQRFAVQARRGEKAIGYARVVSVEKEPLWWAFMGARGREEARREGFDDVTAFRAAFVDINGRISARTYVWRIEFEVARDG